MTIKVENIEKAVDETKGDVKLLHNKIDDFISKCDDKYVTKKQLILLIPIFALAFVGFLVVNHINII